MVMHLPQVCKGEREASMSTQQRTASMTCVCVHP
jgi:hypothetical protein